jgi:hypothetical protein
LKLLLSLHHYQEEDVDMAELFSAAMPKAEIGALR